MQWGPDSGLFEEKLLCSASLSFIFSKFNWGLSHTQSSGSDCLREPRIKNYDSVQFRNISISSARFWIRLLADFISVESY